MTIASGQTATAADVLGKFVSKTGDAMSGPLSLAGDPLLPMQAVTKQYVDAAQTVVSVIATGGSTASPLTDRFSRRLNVIDDFGAKGNGSTDDTAAIQAAFNRAGTTGGTVYFPAGTYPISSQITAMPQVALGTAPTGPAIHFSPIIVINVESDAKATIKATAAMNSMLNFQFNSSLGDIGPFYSAVRGLTLDGNGAAVVGILSNFTMHIDVQNNAIHGCTGPALEILGYGVARIAHNVFMGPTGIQLGTTAAPGGGDTLILKNDFYPDAGSGMCQGILMGPWSGDTEIDANGFTRVQPAGTGTCYGVRMAGDLAPDASHEIRHTVIRDNEFFSTDAAVFGVAISSGRNVWQSKISGNHVYNTYGAIAYLTNCDDFIISENFLNGVQLPDCAGPALTLNACNRVRFAGNIAANYTNSLAVMTDCVDCEVRDNIAQDIGKGGTGFTVVNLLHTFTPCLRNVVAGNKFVQTSNSYAQSGVFEHSGVDQTTAQDNRLVGILTPYVKAGANSVMRTITYGSAAPTTGPHIIGDTVYNTDPTSGGTFAWVCTAAGTPGTWAVVGTA